MADYAHPETLVSTDWVGQHSKDPNVRVVEVDVDTNAYKEGHAPGAIGWAWNSQLCDTVKRDILSKAQFEKLMAESGISTRAEARVETRITSNENAPLRMAARKPSIIPTIGFKAYTRRHFAGMISSV